MTMNKVAEVHIEFAGSQLTVRTNDRRIEDHLRSTFKYMRPSTPTGSAGTVEIILRGNSYDVRVLSDAPRERPWGVMSTLSLPQASELSRHDLLTLNNEVLIRFIVARPDLLWLHGGVVESAQGAIMFGGVSGRGKSTLVTALVERGWRYMSDDIAPVERASSRVYPYPQAPLRRVSSGVMLPPDRVHLLARENVPLAGESIARAPVTLKQLVFLEFGPRVRGELERLKPGPAVFAILESCVNYLDHRHRAVEEAARMAREIPAYILSYSDVDSALAALDQLSRLDNSLLSETPDDRGTL